MALAAVALQDHMARSLSLHDPLKKKKINHSLPVKNSRNLTSKEKCSRKDEDQTKEYVLDPKPAPLTLGKCNADVVVQFNPWFKFFSLSYNHYHTQKQKETKFKPWIKLNHNVHFAI